MCIGNDPTRLISTQFPPNDEEVFADKDRFDEVKKRKLFLQENRSCARTRAFPGVACAVKMRDPCALSSHFLPEKDTRNATSNRLLRARARPLTCRL